MKLGVRHIGKGHTPPASLNLVRYSKVLRNFLRDCMVVVSAQRLGYWGRKGAYRRRSQLCPVSTSHLAQNARRASKSLVCPCASLKACFWVFVEIKEQLSELGLVFLEDAELLEYIAGLGISRSRLSQPISLSGVSGRLRLLHASHSVIMLA